MRQAAIASRAIEGVGNGAPALGTQSDEPDRDASGRGTAAGQKHPVVPANSPSVELSVGAIIEVVHAAAQRAQPVVAEMLKRIRGSPVVHADETGWREDGVNGYVWTLSTPTERYFLRRGRGKGVVDEVLGESPGQGESKLFSGVLVSDFYAAYSHYPDLKQRCWVHLLRDIDELEALYPQDTGLGRWATAVRQLYDRAKASADYPSPPASGYQPSASADQLMLEKLLLSLCQPFSNDDTAPQAKLCRRIERFIKELFVFVSHPGVPADNNAAERSLRHLVVSRKISGAPSGSPSISTPSSAQSSLSNASTNSATNRAG